MDAGSSSRWTSRLAAVIPLFRSRAGQGAGLAPVRETQAAPPDASGTKKSFATVLAEHQSSQEHRQLRALQARDQAVRRHEAAHWAEGGHHVRGAPRYTYERGPDGRYYAVAGETPLEDPRAGGDPQKTLHDAKAVARAALAPAQPSSKDLQVAVEARVAAFEARARMRAESTQKAPEPKAAHGEAAYRSWVAPGGFPERRGRLLDRII